MFQGRRSTSLVVFVLVLGITGIAWYLRQQARAERDLPASPLSEPTSSEDLTTEGGSANSGHKVGIEIEVEEANYHSSAIINENEIFSIVDSNGYGIGFRPNVVDVAGGVVKIAVLELTDWYEKSKSEKLIQTLRLKVGSEMSVPSPDGEGAIKVRISSVEPRDQS